MNYFETIDFLFTKLPMFSRQGAAAYKKDLTNTIALLNTLDNPQNNFKCIHIAGTNGKGSVSHLLASIFQQAGYKTGLYTSPHLKDFRERIKVNGEMVSEAFVIDFTKKIKDQIEKIEPSFFEITVAMAFQYFAVQKVDIAIVETGLGGRLDSTNIILPELSIITNIGLDHVSILGNTLEQIAQEKAGIIKNNTPVVIGEVTKETEPAFTKIAEEKNAPLSIASHKWQSVNWECKNHELIIEIANLMNSEHKIYHLDLTGIYQTKNILTVLESITQLRHKGWKISDEALHDGINHCKKITGLHGRWETLHHSPLIVADVAHNEDGMRQLLEQIEITEYKSLHIVLGMVKDKDIDAVLRLLPQSAHYYFTKAAIPRAMHENELQSKAESFNLKGKTFENVNLAINVARSNASSDDLIVICGSIFLVGEIDEALLAKKI